MSNLLRSCKINPAYGVTLLLYLRLPLPSSLSYSQLDTRTPVTNFKGSNKVNLPARYSQTTLLFIQDSKKLEITHQLSRSTILYAYV